MTRNDQAAGILGNNNRINQQINQIFQHQKTTFLNCDLSRFKPPHVEIKENFIETWMNELRTLKVLVFGGRDFGQLTVVKSLAWHFSGRRSDRTSLSVLEWERSSGLQRLENALETEKKQSLFILPNISTTDLQNGLTGLFSAVNGSDHFVLASSNAEARDWELSGSRHDYWKVVKPEEIYPLNFLRRFLIGKLESSRENLPSSLSIADFDDLGELAPEWSIEKIVTNLKTPDRVALFATLLQNTKTDALTADQVRRMIQVAKDDNNGLRHWFLQLNKRDQQFVMSLIMFEGCSDAQLFSTLDVLVDSSWRRRDPRSTTYDYSDLERFEGYFLFGEPGSNASRISSAAVGQRKALLQLCWQKHRRLLQVTMSFMTDIVLEAAAQSEEQANGGTILGRVGEVLDEFNRMDDDSEASQKSSGPAEANEAPKAGRAPIRGEGPYFEILGTEDRRRRLAWSLELLLSDLGMISIPFVEPFLFRLAASGKRLAVATAARAMSRWRGGKEDNREEMEQAFFAKLSDWQTETRYESEMEEILRSLGLEMVDARACIRVAIAVAISYAALYDPQNNIHNRLLNLLEKLWEDRHSLVKDALLLETLPLLCMFHFDAIKDHLKEWVVAEEGATPYIAAAAALADENDSETIETVELWIEEAKATKKASFSDPSGKRERLLGFAALFYGFRAVKENKEFIREAVHFWKTVLRNEKHLFPRSKVFQAIHFQVKNNLKAFKPFLGEIVSCFSSIEHDSLAVLLTDIHMDQRSEMANDGKFMVDEIGNKRIPVWVEGKRPFTEIEEVIKEWLVSKKNKSARQVAVKALVSIGKRFEMAESAAIKKFQADQEAKQKRDEEKNKILEREKQERQKSLLQLFKRSSERNTVKESLIVQLVGFGRGRLSRLLQDTMPYLWNQDSEDVAFLTNRFNEFGDRSFESFGSSIKKAIWLKRRATALFSAIIFLTVLTVGLWYFLI